MLKKIKCKVCGNRYTPDIKNRYEARLSSETVVTLIKSAKVAECFDCPQCGCQTIVNERHTRTEAPKECD